MNRNLFIFLMFCTIVVSVFAAGTGQTVTLEYFEGNLYIDTPAGIHLEGSELKRGYEIPVGSSITTEGDATAELRLSDSTIIVLDRNTTFTVSKLKGVGGSSTSVFDMTYGKFRAVVAKLTSVEDEYRFQGNAAVCGVRGTGLVMWIRANEESGKEEESAYTLDGRVGFWKKSEPNKVIELKGGQFANAFDDVLAPKPIPASLLDDFNKRLSFKKLNAKDVKVAKLDDDKDKDKDKKPKDDKESSGSDVVVTPPAGGGAETAGTQADSELPDWLAKLLGFEIGSLTIGDVTYAKAVLSPSIEIGALKLGLYLPVIYQQNIFDPDRWYKPDGNSEWSFGFDQHDLLIGAGDFVSDLFLKIKYIEWGKQRDPFYMKLGNLESFTVGHGLLMKNYANDADFPAVRRIGFNLGMDLTNFGFEVMSNDLSKIASSPRIAGLRLYARPAAPAFPLAFGVSAVADFNPAEGMDILHPTYGQVTADVIGNPVFINLAFDLDLPIINTDPLRLIAFADFGGMLPLFMSQGTGSFASIDPGLHTEAMFTGSAFRNFGFSTGFMGNVSFFTYVLDFRYFTGVFKPAFFDAAYDKSSNDLALSTAEYMLDPDDPAYDKTMLGVYLEGGMDWKDVFRFTVGYMIPMTIDDSGFAFGEGQDSFHMEFAILPDVVPVVNLSGSIAYDRSYFMTMITGGVSDTGKALDFFDEYSVLSGELVYGVSKVMDLALILATSVARDSVTGAVIYEPDGVSKKIDFTWSIETRIHF